jgi:dTDP-4-amino-4,6-dideoxygalactose transaminase
MQTVETVLNVPFVDLKAQYASIKPEIDAAIAAVINETAFIGGSVVTGFENNFAAYCGTKHCVGVANGTDALFVALRTLGVGPGDEVITAANSFIATSEAIRMCGAQVVFVDIDAKTYSIDVDRIAEKITSRTKAIIPVHLYGHPIDMDAVRALAKKHGLFIIGDAAQAHGATYKGVPIAELADITCYSFYPGKNLGAYGDAGALVTDREDWANSARMFANHGRTSKYDHGLEGINSRLDGIQAAILDVKLRHLDNWTEGRRRVASAYARCLAGQNVVLPYESSNVKAVYHLYVVRVPAAERARLQQALSQSGISTGIHYPIALPYLKAYEYLGHSEKDFPVALKASSEILSLPMFAELQEDVVQYVADRMHAAL